MSLANNMVAESAKQLNLREPVTVRPTQTVRETVAAMRAKNLGCAILVDDEEKPVGMFTERLLTQMLSDKPTMIDGPVINHSATYWPQIKLSDPVIAVPEALEARNVRFVAVVDDNGRLAGLTGQKGLMEYIADHFPGLVTVQRVGLGVTIHEREGA